MLLFRSDRQSYRPRRPQFSIQTALLVVAVAAVAVAVYPRVSRNLRWADAREALNKWANEQDRSGPPASFSFSHPYLRPESDGRFSFRGFHVSTAEAVPAELPDGTVTLALNFGVEPAPSGFFVMPPGIWVDTIEEIIATWNAHAD